MTGPVFAPILLPNNQWVYMQRTIGSFPKLVSVPTHFFKVIKATRRNKPHSDNQEQTFLGAFLIPNNEIDPNTTIGNFVVKVDELECLTGLRFFDSSITDIDRTALDAVIPPTR